MNGADGQHNAEHVCWTNDQYHVVHVDMTVLYMCICAVMPIAQITAVCTDLGVQRIFVCGFQLNEDHSKSKCHVYMHLACSAAEQCHIDVRLACHNCK